MSSHAATYAASISAANGLDGTVVNGNVATGVPPAAAGAAVLCVPRELGVVTSHTTDPDTPGAPDDPVSPVAPDAPDAPEAPAAVVVDSRSPTNTVESVERPDASPASEHPAATTNTSTAHAAPVATTDTPRHRPPDRHNRDMPSDGTDHTPPREVSTLTHRLQRVAPQARSARASLPAPTCGDLSLRQRAAPLTR